MAKRRKRRASSKRRRFNRNPIRSSRRRFRRNPIEGGAGSFFGGTFIPAAIGAAGAVGTDIALGYFPVPQQFRTGMGGAIVRVFASLGIGWLVGAMSNERTGAEAAAGGIIVTLYQILRPWSAQNLPLRMSRYVPMAGMGNRRRRRMNGIPRAVTVPPNMRGRIGNRPRRVRRMAAFANPARQAGGMTPVMMRYIATNPR